MKYLAALLIALSLSSCVNYAQPTFGDDDREVGNRFHYHDHSKH